MSYMHDFQVKYLPKIEKCDFIPPERIREACIFRNWTYKEASEKCDIEYKEFCSYANGHKDIPDELILKLMSGFRLPKQFFYQLKWGRVDY